MTYKIKSKKKYKNEDKYRISTTKRDFLMDDDGEQADKYLNKLLNQGYVSMYYSAPYYWGVFNPKTRKIITYAEGDIDTTSSPTQDSFEFEIQKEKQFLSEYDKKLYEEAKENLKEYNL
jgi:hypothetical protein